jgi:hypothetical protein
MRILYLLPALLSLAACGGDSPPPKTTVFDTMTRQEKALPAAVEQAQDAHMQELKRQEEAATAPGR